MRKVLVVARREYFATVATKGFVIGLVVLPVLMFAGTVIPGLLKGKLDTADKHIVVVDGTGELLPKLQAAAEAHNQLEIWDRAGKQEDPRYVIEPGPDGPITDATRMALSERVRKEEIYAFVEVPPDLLTAAMGAE